MRKIRFLSMSFVFAIFFSVYCLFSIMGFIVVSADDSESEEVISYEFSTYADNKGYTGKKIASHIDSDKYATINFTEDGGTHIDGDGDLVFSNYVIFSIDLNFDKATKVINGTNVLASKDTYDWSAMNKANDYKYTDEDSGNNTEKQISYGAICALRTNSDGSIYKYAPIFSTGETTLSEQIFNVDGDYELYIFFETSLNGKTQNHVLKCSFKIRSYVYLLDAYTELPIKESGISGSAILLDSASRQNITIDVYFNGGVISYTADQLSEGKVCLEDDGTYKFVVKDNNFICEVFYFTIDSESVDKKVFFNNLNSQIGDYTYQAEGWVSFTWDDNTSNPVMSVSYINMYDLENVSYETINGTTRVNLAEQKTTEYTKDTVIDEVGTYLIRVQFATASVDYYINITSMDNPSYNYEKLTAARFNTFKTKWWQVYDQINDRYLCFDYETEYDRAYNAAMTVANNSVIEVGGKLYFNGIFYNDRIDLTAAMNDYVFDNNLKTVYYDPDDYSDNDSSLRTFSSASFDDSIYLNDDFQFLSQHSSEVNSVVLVSVDGTEFDIQFSVPISEQGIPDGQYTVIETDKYGNETRYVAYRDKSAPNVILGTNSGNIEAEDGGNYYAKNFNITTFSDSFDKYAVLKINYGDKNSYFYMDEFDNNCYLNKGEYLISAYDRNGNTMSFTVTIL